MKIVQLKIELKGSKPLIWRRLQVPNNITFNRLHKILNTAMGWYESHLYLFELADFRIGDKEWDDSGDWLSDKKVKLSEMIQNAKTFVYLYDFGDGWQHKIKIEKILEVDTDQKYPVCIGGANNCPPEDCGGLGGFEDFKTIITDKNHPEYGHLFEWYGREYDATEFSVEDTNATLPSRKKL